MNKKDIAQIINILLMNARIIYIHERKITNMEIYNNPIPKLNKVSIEDEKIADVGSKVLDTYAFKESVYFAFIDALGFKKDFKEKEAAFEEVFSYYFELMNNTKFLLDDWYAGQTSDSLYFYTSRQDYLIEFLEVFSYFNLYAMTKNIFFRGGIAKGKLYYKENHQFYGDSVINAYLLESDVAHYPRIMIDARTYKDIGMDKKSLGLIKKDWNNEGRYYLSIFTLLGKKPKIDVKNFDLIYEEINEKMIYQIISDNMKTYEYDERTYNKYSYLMKEYKKHKEQEKKNE